MVYCIIFVQRIHQKALLDWLCHRNIQFCQYWLFTINSYLSFLNIISIDLKVWGYPTLPISWFINFNGWIMIRNFVILYGKMKGIDWSGWDVVVFFHPLFRWHTYRMSKKRFAIHSNFWVNYFKVNRVSERTFYLVEFSCISFSDRLYLFTYLLKLFSFVWYVQFILTLQFFVFSLHKWLSSLLSLKSYTWDIGVFKLSRTSNMELFPKRVDVF